mmetsp:Transcript_199/g.254  ORF Transcript_199/g.254 Transcript_199/m.254 type:complete len:1047 (+) Transcript_199:133-3273(+)
MPPSTTATERMMIPEETSFHYNGSIMLADSSDEEEDEDEYNPEDENLHPNASRKKKKQVQMKAAVVKQEQTKNNMPDRRSLMKKQGSSSRRRRRSSARFLKISDTETVEDAAGGAGGTGGVGSQSQLNTGDLGEVYRNAIRMNAENRINASNSWNLNLIDHLDQLVAPELRKGSKASRTLINGKKGRGSKSNNNTTTMDSSMMNSSMHSMNSTTTVPGMPSTGVNFTKASCSLDASVKIYSYRVDDVHLTSYKVLANLNRTETNQTKNKKKNGATTDGADAGATTEDGGADGADGADVGGSNGGRITKSRGSGDTIEHNTANLNIHKLDAAFDIDPLFHKMSKNFDEGGAKGLLLANLGVGTSGCNIIFDSSLDNVDDDDDNGESEDKEAKEGVEEGEEKEGEDPPKDADVDHTSSNTVVDVTSLIAKLESLLISNGDNNGYSNKIGSIPLVPQLAALRSQFFDLDNDGFVDNVVSSQRYAASNEEEAEADKSIHLEAIERSRASQAFQARRGSDGGTLNSRDSYASNDGGGFDFGGGGDADADDFVDMHDGDHRFSSNSFQADATGAARTSFSSFGNEYRQSFSPSSQQEQQPPPPSQASVLLDAIASGHISTTMESSNHYEYFNSQALANLSQGNLWAGAEHWKKMPSSSRRKTCGGSTDDTSVTGNKTPGKKKKGRKGKAVTKSTMEWSVAVHLDKEIEYNLDELLQKPTVAPPPKKKRGGKVAKAKVKADPLQVSKAMKTKYEKNDNLLPIDAGLEVKEFTTLYGRPKTNLMDLAKARHEAAVAASSSLGKNRSTKMVGFGGVETWDGNDSYGGGDDDGAGFDFGGGGDDDNIDHDDHNDDNDPNEFVVPELTDVRKIEKIKIGYAKIARKVDVKRLKRDLWTELERTFALKAAAAAQHNTNSNDDDGDGKAEVDVETNLSTASTVSDPDLDLVDTADSGGDDKDVDNEEVLDSVATKINTNTASPSFQGIVRDMQQNQSQSDVTLPYYFICILHLCNEKELALESTGLDDFMIHRSLEDMQLQQQQHDDDELSCVPRRPRR